MQVKAKEILLRAKKDVFSGNLGNYLTTFKGDGLDFKEIRDYEFGDNIRRINWKATAKGNGLKTNVFNEERELNIVLAFMLSGSIHFGSIKLKQEVIAEILTLLSYSALKNDNRLQSLFFDKKVVKFFEPTKKDTIVYDILENSLSINLIGREINYKAFCDFINGVIRGKSLIFIIGDFYGDIDLSEIAYKNEVYAIIVRDRFEENPKLNGEYELRDTTTLKSSTFVLNQNIAQSYHKLIYENDKRLKEHFLQHKITFGKIYTDENINLRLYEIIKG